MAVQPAAADARHSIHAHVAALGAETHDKYGPQIGWSQLRQILRDRNCVRYPCEIAFDASGLEAGEFAHPAPKGDRPEEGFVMYVHPHFMTRLEQVPLLVLYQLVLVNYGRFASPDDAETFGAAVLGLPRDEYYAAVCALADELNRLAPGALKQGMATCVKAGNRAE